MADSRTQDSCVQPSPAIQNGYRLGYYKLPSGRVCDAVIQVELFTGSKIVDERRHEVYDCLKTDLMKIVKIENLSGDTLETAFLVKKPELKYDIKAGEVIRFKHSDFTESLPDVSYFTFYTTRIGALNQSKEVKSNFTGSLCYYYANGRLREKHYYANGVKATIMGYYDNAFNSLYYSWMFDQLAHQTFPVIREYIYSLQENPIAQYLIHEGKVIKEIIYDKNTTTPITSIYLTLGEL